MVFKTFRWKELDLVSIQTVSNIITFIQWAIIPIDTINIQSQSKLSKIKQIISTKFSSIINFFSSPFDFIKQYNLLLGSIKVVLSSILIFSFMVFMFNIFFLPSWHFFIFFGDLFLSGLLTYQLSYISNKNHDKETISILIIIIAIFYFIFRIFYLFYPHIKLKKFLWTEKSAITITSVFLSRLKKNRNEEDLDLIIQQIGEEIDAHDFTIQFDEQHFNNKNKKIDLSITISIFIIILIFVIVGWKTIFKNKYENEQLEDASYVCNIITYALFSGICLRIIFNVLWLTFKNQELLI